MCLGNVSKDFTIDNMKKTGSEGNDCKDCKDKSVKIVSVDYIFINI